MVQFVVPEEGGTQSGEVSKRWRGACGKAASAVKM